MKKFNIKDLKKYNPITNYSYEIKSKVLVLCLVMGILVFLYWVPAFASIQNWAVSLNQTDPTQPDFQGNFGYWEVASVGFMMASVVISFTLIFIGFFGIRFYKKK